MKLIYNFNGIKTNVTYLGRGPGLTYVIRHRNGNHQLVFGFMIGLEK